MKKNLLEFVDECDRYDYVQACYKLNDISVNKECSYSELDRNIKGNLYLVKFCSFGDYDNSCAVERSNYRVFLEMFGKLPGIYLVSGGYNSKGIVIDIEKNIDNQEIIDVLSALTDYPVIDEEDLSNLELEIENESFDDTFKDELKEGIEAKMQEISGNEDYELKNNIDLREIYEKLKEKTNTYFEIEAGGTGYIDIDRLVDGFTIGLLLKQENVELFADNEKVAEFAS